MYTFEYVVKFCLQHFIDFCIVLTKNVCYRVFFPPAVCSDLNIRIAVLKEQEGLFPPFLVCRRPQEGFMFCTCLVEFIIRANRLNDSFYWKEFDYWFNRFVCHRSFSSLFFFMSRVQQIICFQAFCLFQAWTWMWPLLLFICCVLVMAFKVLNMLGKCSPRAMFLAPNTTILKLHNW